MRTCSEKLPCAGWQMPRGLTGGAGVGKWLDSWHMCECVGDIESRWLGMRTSLSLHRNGGLGGTECVIYCEFLCKRTAFSPVECVYVRVISRINNIWEYCPEPIVIRERKGGKEG